MPAATVATHPGVFDLILHAGLVGKTVLLFLLASSVWSWTLIFSKNKVLKEVASQNKRFTDSFWSGRNIEDIFATSDQYSQSTVAAVFKSGYREFKKHPDIENIGRALSRSTTEEVSQLEKNVSWLATVASASPFVGLFGTVWGIMDSFQGIGATGSANLATVAPGISEALVATAAGIAVAVPAVVGYNHFANKIRRAAVEMETFSQDFLNLLKRSISGEKIGG